MRSVTIVSTKQPLTLRSCSTQLVCISHIYFLHQQTNKKDIAILALLNTTQCDDVDDHNNDDDDEDGDYRNYDDGDDD